MFIYASIIIYNMVSPKDSKTEYQEIGGIQTYVHKPADTDSFVSDLCEYTEQYSSIGELDTDEKGALGERAAVKYAKAQGYEDIHPAEVDEVESHDPGVDVSATDPETGEKVAIEAKTIEGQISKDNLGKPKYKGFREGKGSATQHSDSWIHDDSGETVEQAFKKDGEGELETDDDGNIIVDDEQLGQGIEQTSGEVVGTRKELVGIQPADVANEPIHENLNEVGFERAHITQVDWNSERSHSAGNLAEDPWGTNHAGFSIQNKIERRQERTDLSGKAEQAYDSIADQIDTKGYGTVGEDLQGEYGPEEYVENPRGEPSELEDIKGIGPEMTKKLEDADDIDLNADPPLTSEEIAEIDGFGEELSSRVADNLPLDNDQTRANAETTEDTPSQSDSHAPEEKNSQNQIQEQTNGQNRQLDQNLSQAEKANAIENQAERRGRQLDQEELDTTLEAVQESDVELNEEGFEELGRDIAHNEVDPGDREAVTDHVEGMSQANQIEQNHTQKNQYRQL